MIMNKGCEQWLDGKQQRSVVAQFLRAVKSVHEEKTDADKTCIVCQKGEIR